METLLSLAIALFAGLLLSRLAKLIHLPAVTAYLVAGILIGPYCIGAFNVGGLGFNSAEQLDNLKIICEVALGFIAFSIGNEFRLKQIRGIGKQALVIGIFQAVVATIAVDLALIGLSLIIPDKFPMTSAIVLGAIASATAPAATLMVVRQYKAHGPVTDTLLPVVAIDDAVGLILFAISFGIGNAVLVGQIDMISILVEPLLEVVLSILLGAIMGGLITFFERFFHSRSKRLSIAVSFVFLAVALSMLKFEIGEVHIGFSSLLTCMMLGTIFCNICDFSEELMDRLDRWTAPLFILFFVISGAELQLSIFANYLIVIIGVVYILFRSLGKYFGASISSTLVKSPKTVRKYLGITLLPQAGVALGMALQAHSLGAAGVIVSNITLFSVLIYELFGPFLTKVALEKAGEINPEGKKSYRKKHERKHRHHRHDDPHHHDVFTIATETSSISTTETTKPEDNNN